MHTKAYILIPFKLLWGMIIQVFGALMSNTIIHRQIILSETQNMLPETKSINAIFGFFMVLYSYVSRNLYTFKIMHAVMNF